MKKVIAIVFMVLFLLGVTACQKTSAPDTSPEYKFGTDCQYYNFTDAGYEYFAESEKGIYYLGLDGYIKVIDPQTMQGTVLCNKPDCLHDAIDIDVPQERKEQCNAYFPSHVGLGFCYYEGSLYGVQMAFDPVDRVPYYELIKISLDGTRRKKIWTIQWKEDIIGSPRNLFLHRGKVYFLVSKFDEYNNPSGTMIYSYSLQKKTTQKILDTPGHLQRLYAIGNHLYVSEVKGDQEDLLQINLSNHKIHILKDCQMVLPEEKRLFFYYVDILLEDETYHLTHSLEVADLDGNERQKYSQIDLNEVREFIKQIQVTDGLMYVMDSSAGVEIRVYETISGDKIATLVVPEEFVKKGQRVISCTCEGKVLLYSLINEENRECIFYCDISTIGTPDFQWYEVEKVN